MDPITIALISMAAVSMMAGIGGTYMSYVGARKQAAAQKKIGKYNAQQAENQAKQERLDRAEAEKQERRDSMRRISALENMYAASGVLVDGTSALDALAEQAATDEMNILNRTRVSENRAKQIQSQGKLGLWEANVSAKASKMKGYAALVDGVGGVASSGFSMGTALNGRVPSGDSSNYQSSGSSLFE